MKTIACIVLATAAALPAAAKDWYVDPVNGLDTRDGTTSNVVSETVGPRRTLEKAMALVGAGDTLWLLPGEYAEGSMRDGRARLYIAKNNVKVKSTDGAARTFIVGEGGTAISSTSSKACAHVNATGVIIEGVTFKDGCGQRHDGIKDNGGGLRDEKNMAWAIDCVFTNCYAYAGGGMYQCNALRCRFVDCRAADGGGGAAYSFDIAFCLFQNCTPSAYKTFPNYLTKFYNCTFCGTTGSALSIYTGTPTVPMCNSIVAGHSNNGAACLYATNCVLGTQPLSAEAVNCVSNVSLAASGLIDPFHGDVRVATRSAAVNLGDASLLADLAIPDGYELTDLLGRPVPTSGPITAGCVQETAVQTGASLTFSSRSFEVKDYGTYPAGGTLCPTSVPTVFYLKPILSEGEHLWGIRGEDNIGGSIGTVYHRQPLADGWVPFSPFASAESNMTVTAMLATGVWYADAENGNDAWDGTAATHEEGTDHGPKQTLQAAGEAASGNWPLVYAAPGVYSNGVSTVTVVKNGTTYTCRRRLYATKRIGFRSTGGAERTVIMGEPDPDTGGLGDNAIAGVLLEGSYVQFLQGFTITGCYTPNGIGSYILKGAAFASAAYRAWMHDCIISNNFSREGIISYGISSRCRVFDNTSYRYTAGPYGICFSSVFARNRIECADSDVYASFTSGHPLYGCTVDLRSSLSPDGRKHFSREDANAYNSIVLGYNGTETDCFRNSIASEDHPVADAAAYDFRLGALSPAVGAAAYAEMSDYLRRAASFDVDGKPIVVKDGMANLGAVQNDPPLPCVVIVGGGRETLTGGCSMGTNVVTSGGDVTVTAMAGRQFVGFEVDGELLPYAGRSYTFAVPTEPGAVKTVRVVYDTEWYIDCVNGDDANDGSLAHPKRTIRAATTNAVAGDVIHVAPGTYGALEGSQKWPDETSAIGTRVVIPAGVTVESTGGATNTFIVGEASPDPAVTEGWQAGIGPGAVRCVVAEKGATLRGFTLKEGYTHAGTSALEKDRYCSAFYSASALGAAIEDCVVSNNVAHTYTMYQAVVRRCRVIGNTAANGTDNTTSGAAGNACAWYNSIIANNNGNATLLNPVVVESCTIGNGNVYIPGTSAQALYWNDGKPKAIFNTVWINGRLQMSGSTQLYCTNCLVNSSRLGTNLSRDNCSNTLFMTASEMKFDSEYRPNLDSPAIDAGDAAYSSSALGDTDILGTPRVLNGALDIGAVEYDWRPAFNAELGRRFRLEYASPSVTTNAAGGVLVPDGSVAGTVTSAGPYEIAFSVTGGGLAVYVGGELADESSGAGEQSIRFIVADAADEVRFVFTPDAENPGSAVLKKVSGARGFSISFR